MSMIDRVLKGIKAHIKNQCERCSYDGGGCVNQLLRESEVIVEKAKEAGMEIPDTPVCALSARELLRAIRNGRREYIYATGHLPAVIRMTRDTYEAIEDHVETSAFTGRKSIYGVLIEIEDAPQQNGCFGFTEGDVNG